MFSIECSVTAKDENKKLVNKYLIYEALNLDMEDRTIQRMVQETMDQFKIDPQLDERPSIIIKATLVYQ